MITQVFQWLRALLRRPAPITPNDEMGRMGGTGTFSIGE
jgi:hypothetical protein